MSSFMKDKWNEFDWEKELKKDDKRIAAYMEELPRYIDLPSEDDVIMKRILEKPELIPADPNLALDSLDDFFPEEEDPSPITEDWKTQPGSDFYMAASRLSRMWAQSYAGDTSEPVAVHGIRILCLYGEIMARTWDLIDMEDEDYPALRIALCKRLLVNVNALMGEFSFLEENAPAQKETALFHYGQLLIFRNKILNLLHKFRFPDEGKKGGKKQKPDRQ